jgi:hypothetical protein
MGYKEDIGMIKNNQYLVDALSDVGVDVDNLSFHSIKTMSYLARCQFGGIGLDQIDNEEEAQNLIRATIDFIDRKPSSNGIVRGAQVLFPQQ